MSRIIRCDYSILINLKELPRYSDKYRSSTIDQPSLKRKDLHAPFFPPEVFEGYFNPRRKLRSDFIFWAYSLSISTRYASVDKKVSPAKLRMNLDEMGDEEEDQAWRFYNPIRNALTQFFRKNRLNVLMPAPKELNLTMTSMRNTTMITPKTTLTMARAMTWMI